MTNSTFLRLSCMAVLPVLLAGCNRSDADPNPVPPAEATVLLPQLTTAQVRSARTSAIPDSIYLTDNSKKGLFVLDASDRHSTDNTGLTLVTAAGERYKRVFTGAANAAWFDVAVGDPDIGPELQNAVNSSDLVIIPDGVYTQLTKVILRSNVTIKANPGQVTLRLTGAEYISFQNFWLAESLENITIDGLNWEVASTATVEGSYGPITIDGPSVRNLTVQNCRSIHTSPTARVNWFFLKVQPGRVTDNIVVQNNYALGARMGAEFLAQRLPEKYLGKNITCSRNRFENCGFGISVAGSFDGVDVSDNYLKDCPTYGVEFAGWLHNARLTNNRFEGRFSDLFAGNWEDDGDGTVSPAGTQILNNATVGTCTGKWSVRNGFNMLMQNNSLQMTGVLDISGASNNAQYVNNTFVSTTQNKVIQVNDVGNQTFTGNYISNEGVMNGWLLIVVNGAASTNNVFTGNTLVRSTGGIIDAGNGATYQFYNNYDKFGVPVTP